MPDPTPPPGNNLPKSVGVYDRPIVKRSSRMIIIVGVVMLVIAFVLVFLLR